VLIPDFGTKSHINTDRCYWLIRRFWVTHAAAHDGARLLDLLNRNAFGSRIWAGSACRSKANGAALEAGGYRSMIHCKKPNDRPMPVPHRCTNRAGSAVRSAIEHVFANRSSA
jgi:IS5 family transposase